MAPTYADAALAAAGGARLRSNSGPAGGNVAASLEMRRLASLLSNPEAGANPSSLFSFGVAPGSPAGLTGASPLWEAQRANCFDATKPALHSARLATAAAAASAAAQLQQMQLAIPQLPGQYQQNQLGQQHLDALADKMGSAMQTVQRHGDADKRTMEKRLDKMEKQLQSAVGRIDADRSRDDGREKWAELQGSLHGLVDETQAVTRRVDGLDERLWTRTNAAEEVSRQGNREVQQQLQGMERQMRLSGASAEELQRRQTAKQRRAEHLMEDFAWRLAKAEEEQAALLEKMAQIPAPVDVQQIAQSLQASLEASGNRLHEACTDVEALSERLHSVEAQLAANAVQPAHQSMSNHLALPSVDEDPSMSIVPESHHLEREFATLERKVSTQLEELAANIAGIKVKVDSHQERHHTLAGRLETAHVPAVESLRNELSEKAGRELRDLEGRLAELSQKVEMASEHMDTEKLADTVSGLTSRISSSEALVASQRRDAEDLRAEVRRTLDRAISAGPVWGSPPPMPILGGGRPETIHEHEDLHEQSQAALAALERGLDANNVAVIQEQLHKVAEELEVLDEISSNVQELFKSFSGVDTRVGALEKWSEIARKDKPSAFAADKEFNKANSQSSTASVSVNQPGRPSPLAGSNPSADPKPTISPAPGPTVSGRLGVSESNVSRRTSFDSTYSAADAVTANVSADEAVDDAASLSRKCDVVLDIVPPAAASAQPADALDSLTKSAVALGGRMKLGQLRSAGTPSFGQGGPSGGDSLDAMLLPSPGRGNRMLAPLPGSPRVQDAPAAQPDDAVSVGHSDSGRQSYVSEAVSMDESLAEFMEESDN